jgi:hypothetical protein
VRRSAVFRAADGHEFRRLSLPDVPEVDRLGAFGDHGARGERRLDRGGAHRKATVLGLGRAGVVRRLRLGDLVPGDGRRALCGERGIADRPLFDDANGLTMTNEIYIDHKPDSYAFAGEGRQVLTRAQCVEKFPLLASE